MELVNLTKGVLVACLLSVAVPALAQGSNVAYQTATGSGFAKFKAKAIAGGVANERQIATGILGASAYATAQKNGYLDKVPAKYRTDQAAYADLFLRHNLGQNYPQAMSWAAFRGQTWRFPVYGSNASTRTARTASTAARATASQRGSSISAEDFAVIMANQELVEAFLENAPDFAAAIRSNTAGINELSSRIDGQAGRLSELEAWRENDAASEEGQNERIATAADDAQTALDAANDASVRVTALDREVDRRLGIVGSELALVKRDQAIQTDDVKTLSGKVADFSGRLDGLEGQFETQSNRFDGLEGDLATLSNVVETRSNWALILVGFALALLLGCLFGLRKLTKRQVAQQEALDGRPAYQPVWWKRWIIFWRKPQEPEVGIVERLGKVEAEQSSGDTEELFKGLSDRVDQVVGAVSGVDFDRALVSRSALQVLQPGMENAIKLPVTARAGGHQWLLKIERVENDLIMIHGVSRRKDAFVKMQPVAARNVIDKIDEAALDGRLSEAIRLSATQAA